MGFDQSLTIHEPVRMLSIYDTCISRDVMGDEKLEQYRESRDKSLLSYVESEDDPPVWFTMRPISNEEIGLIFRDVGSNITRACIEVFRVACVGVEGLQAVDESGNKVFVRYQRDTHSGHYKRLSDETMTFIPMRVQVELGSWAMQKSMLNGSVRKNS